MSAQTDKLTKVNEIRALAGLKPLTQARLDREEATLAVLRRRVRPDSCPRCGRSCKSHTGTYCQHCGEDLLQPKAGV
jgi:tRNA(Ile2) C34 agmatinyltransferase TiaS